MAVADRKYRCYEGPLTPQWSRFLIIPRYAFQEVFGSRLLAIEAVADGLIDRKWVVGRALEPPSIQLMINMAHKDIVDEFLGDLATTVSDVKAGRVVSRGTKAVYAV